MPDQKPVQIIHDLDLIDSQNIGIKWNGKTYIIGDLKVGQAMQISLAYSKLVQLELKLAENQEVDRIELARAYYDVLSIVIEDITPSEILEMGQEKVNLILNVIARKLTGDPTLKEDLSKKKLQNPQKQAQNNKSSLLSFFRKFRLFATSSDGPTKKS